MANKFLLAMGICLAVAVTGYAEITVGNAQFEDVYLAPGGYTYTITPWQTSNASGPPAWISNGYYSGEPAPVDSAIYTTTDHVWQDLSDTFVEGETYVFKMGVGAPDWTNYDSFGWEIYIYDATAGDHLTPLSTASGTLTRANGETGTWTMQQVSYVSTAAEAGNAIGIGFRGIDYYTMFDDATVVPEPATMALLGLGALGLIRRKRS